MRQTLSRLTTPLSDWRSFTGLLVLVFILRGLFVLSVLPPFEGWDEYQHIAYIEFYLEKGEPPVLHESEVPTSLYSDLVRYPHCAAGADQIRRIGALNYEQFWQATEPPTVLPGAPRIPLYQAQHASFYYRCVAPLYARLKSAGGILAAVTGLRLVNLLLGAAAIAIALAGIGRIMKPGAPRFITAILIAAQPLFLMNCTRVANDAMAVIFGTIVITLMLLPGKRPPTSTTIFIGLALGLGILAKTIILGLVPFILFALVHAVWKKNASPRQAVSRAAICLTIAAAVTFPYFSFNLRHFGMLSPMQEAVQNRTSGRNTTDLVRAATEINWLQLLQSRYLRHSLWSSGWSLHSPGWRFFGVDRLLMKAHEYLILAAGVGGLFLLSRKRRDANRLFQQPGTAPKILLLWAAISAALSFHALHTYLALPNIATNSWYAAVIFPWMLVLFIQGLAGFPWRAVLHAAAGALLLVFLTTEIYGVMGDMVPTFTGESWGPLARERISSMHLPGLGSAMTLPALILALAGFGFAAAVWIKSAVAERSPPEVKETGAVRS